MANYNRVLGKVRLKTIQVEENFCSTTISLNDGIPFCYTEALHISTSPYGTTGQWIYVDDSQESSFKSQTTNREYPGGGFIVDLDIVDYNKTLATLQSLHTGNCIDLNTRAVVASWTLYNVNLNKIATIRVLFEFGLSGNMQSSAQVYQLNASFYTNSQGRGLATIEIHCLLYIFFEFVIREIFEVSLHSLKELIQ